MDNSAISVNSTSDDQALNDIFAGYLVLSRTFESMLKKPEDDDDDTESTGASNQMNKSIASDIARVVTGFGE